MIAVFLAAQLAVQAGTDTLRLTLRQAMETARATGYTAQAARSRSVEARSRVNESRAALLPHFGATASDVVRSFDLPAMGLSFPAAAGPRPSPILSSPSTPRTRA